MSPDKTTLDGLKIQRSDPPARSARPALWGTVIVLLLLGAGAAWRFGGTRAVLVRTATVQAASRTGTATLLNASGYVTARRAATVSSKVTGRVVEVLIEEGTKVPEGQVLARIDATNVETNLRLAESQVASARAATGETAAGLEQARRTLRRITELAARKVATDAELDNAQADVAMLEARLERQKAEVVVAERGVGLWRQQLDDTVIRAPFAGVVTSKNAQPGEMISPMSAGGSFTRTGICTIVDMSSLEVEVDVSESYINRVAPGQPVVVTLDSYPDWHIPSKVIAIIPTADRQKATVRVRVGFDALDPRMLPDMGLKVAFQGTESAEAASRTVRVPKSAIRRSDGRDTAWVVVRDRLERRAVAVEATRGDEVTLAGGLAPGERVVTEGPDSLAEGTSVAERP